MIFRRSVCWRRGHGENRRVRRSSDHQRQAHHDHDRCHVFLPSMRAGMRRLIVAIRPAIGASAATRASSRPSVAGEHHDCHEDQAQQRKEPETVEGGNPAEIHDLLLIRKVVVIGRFS